MPYSRRGQSDYRKYQCHLYLTQPHVTEIEIYEIGDQVVYSEIKHWLNIFKWLPSQVSA